MDWRAAARRPFHSPGTGAVTRRRALAVEIPAQARRLRPPGPMLSTSSQAGGQAVACALSLLGLIQPRAPHLVLGDALARGRRDGRVSSPCARGASASWPLGGLLLF